MLLAPLPHRSDKVFYEIILILLEFNLLIKDKYVFVVREEEIGIP